MHKLPGISPAVAAGSDARRQGPSAAVGGAQSIRRAIALIRAVIAGASHGITVAEAAASTGIDRTTAHRMLHCLAEEGMLGYRVDTRRFVLGALADEIGAAAGRPAGRPLDLRAVCRPALVRIAAETDDTVFLMARVGYDSVCADRQEGGYPVKTLVVDVGHRRPLGIGAGSLAILSALAPAEAEAALRSNAERIAAFPGMNVARLRTLAARVRADGYASLQVTGITGVRALAVAIGAPALGPLGALSVAAVNSRMTRERQAVMLAILRREAAHIGAQFASAAGS